MSSMVVALSAGEGVESSFVKVMSPPLGGNIKVGMRLGLPGFKIDGRPLELVCWDVQPILKSDHSMIVFVFYFTLSWVSSGEEKDADKFSWISTKNKALFEETLGLGEPSSLSWEQTKGLIDFLKGLGWEESDPHTMINELEAE